MQRYKFNTCTRNPGESIASYVARLRDLTQYCEFGDTLELMLRDRLVCGVGNEQLQRRLLAEPELTFQKAMKLSQTFESAMQDARKLQDEPKHTPAVQVHALPEGAGNKSGPLHSQTSQCYRCGGNHRASSCKFKESICHHCKKKGHIAKQCRSRPKTVPSRRPQSNGTKQTHQVTVDDSADQSYTMFNMPSTRTKPIQTSVNVEKQDIQMEVDTGAALSIISERVYKTFSPVPTLQPTQAKLCTYTGENIQVLGSITVLVCHNQQRKHLPLLVVSGEGPSLLGRDWLAQLQLNWSTIFQLETDGALQTVLDRHVAVFGEELGKLQGTTVKLHVDAMVQPKFCKPRPVPFSQ